MDEITNPFNGVTFSVLVYTHQTGVISSMVLTKPDGGFDERKLT